jgi:UPF0148 protein
MEEEEMLGRITRLLEQGCTMLATHHSCGAPLFRCKGEVVCPVCSFAEPVSAETASKEPATAVAKDQEDLTAKGVGLPASVEKAGSKPVKGNYVREAEEMLAASLSYKIRDLAAKIESEQDLERLQKELDCIGSLLRVLESLKRMQS